MTHEQRKQYLQAKVELRIEIEDLLVGWREYVLSDNSYEFVARIIIDEFGGISISDTTYKIYKTYLKIYNENNFVRIEKISCN